MDVVEIDKDAGFYLHGHCREAFRCEAIGGIEVRALIPFCAGEVLKAEVGKGVQAITDEEIA